MHSVIKGITTKIVKIMSVFIFQEKREPTEVKLNKLTAMQVAHQIDF